MLEIYCDGACSGNPGPGGWGAILIWQDKIKKISGFELHTTNNRMELTAAINALEGVKHKVKIRIHTDSQYLKRGITEWMQLWKRNNWKNGKVMNQDLWHKIDELNNKFDIEWCWVKGHSGNKYNEIADELATNAIKNNKYETSTK